MMKMVVLCNNSDAKEHEGECPEMKMEDVELDEFVQYYMSCICGAKVCVNITHEEGVGEA